MSQAGIISVTNSILPPDVPTLFVTDNGTVIPAGHIVNINGGSTSANNSIGIQVIAAGDGSNNELIQLTNRITGFGSTVSAPSTVTLITFPLGAVPAAYQITVNTIGRAVPPGIQPGVVGVFETLTVYTDGTTATLVNTIKTLQDVVGLTPVLAYTSVVGNTVIVQGFGSPGYDVSWYSQLTYIQV